MKKIYSIKHIMVMALTLVISACSSTKPLTSADQEAELKLLNEQSMGIIASVKKEQPVNSNQIMPGDELVIQVWLRDRVTQFRGFPLQQTVPASGEIFVPDFGSVIVTSKTDSELKILLSKHFEKTLREPTIIVEHAQKIATTTAMSEKQAIQTVRHVVIMGWIASPNLYPFEPGMTIRSALAQSGEVKEFADITRIFVVRGSIDKPTVIRVNLKKALLGKDMSQNILLHPNDAIYVPCIRMWIAYDVIRKALLPISAVRDAVWVGTSAITVK